MDIVIVLLSLFWLAVAMLSAASVYGMRKIIRAKEKALHEVVEALRLTVEYVGTDTLPALEGWSWYDTLLKYSPQTIADIGEHPREGSNLVSHAHRELMLIGEEEATIQGYLRVVQAFADMGHSGGSASVAIPVLHELLQFHSLMPLTNDPAEWHHHTAEVWGEPGGVWQNRRNGEAFSEDGGKTYYLLPECTENNRPIHTSEEKVQDVL